MKYHYIRLFAVQKEQPPILVGTGDIPARGTRQEYLIQIFGKRIDFAHQKKEFVYVPIGMDEHNGDGPIILGRIGREIIETENAPPEAGFEETTHESWRAANLLIDSRDHPDGQKVAFQSRGDVGKPLSVTVSLVNHINETNPDSGWALEANLITDKSTFWDVARERKGEITAAIFTFVTPNILRIRSQLNDDLRSAREDHNARRVTQVLENPDGDLNLEGQDVEDSVDYISEGGGSAKLKSGKQVIYNSENEEKVVEVEEDEPLTPENRSAWRALADMIFK